MIAFALVSFILQDYVQEEEDDDDDWRRFPCGNYLLQVLWPSRLQKPHTFPKVHFPKSPLRNKDM